MFEELNKMKGPFLPGIELKDVEKMDAGSVKITLIVHASIADRLSVINKVAAKLLRSLPKGVRLGPVRYAVGEPFVLTLIPPKQ